MWGYKKVASAFNILSYSLLSSLSKLAAKHCYGGIGQPYAYMARDQACQQLPEWAQQLISLPQIEPSQEITAPTSSYNFMTDLESQRHPAKPHLDSWSTETDNKCLLF